MSHPEFIVWCMSVVLTIVVAVLLFSPWKSRRSAVGLCLLPVLFIVDTVLIVLFGMNHL